MERAAEPGPESEVGAVGLRPRAMLAPWEHLLAEGFRLSVAGIVTVNILNAFAIITKPQTGQGYWFLMDGESNPTTWLNVVLLLVASLLAVACREIDTEPRRRFWSIAALGLLAMSADEIAVVHERVGGNLSSALGRDGEIAHVWVLPWGLLAVVVIVLAARSRPRLPRSTSRRLVVGIGLVLLGAVGMELVGVQVPGTFAEWSTDALISTTLEENLELVGVLLIARALARHALDVERGPSAMLAG